MAKTACIAFGLGCTRAKVDTAQLFEYLRLNGWETAERLEQADLVVVNSCGFDSLWEATSLRLLESADRRRKPGSSLVVTGCLAGLHEERIRTAFGATVVPPLRAEMLDDAIGATVKLRDVPDPHLVDDEISRAAACFDERERFGRIGGFLVRSGFRESLIRLGLKKPQEDLGTGRRSYSIRVAWGCRGECTYCSIPTACSGGLRSKPLDVVLSEFDDGLSQGHRDIRLLAPDLGAWGQDCGSDVTVLLRCMFERPYDFRLTLVDFNTRWAVKHRDDLAGLLSRNADRVEALAMPVQSGSDRILLSMGRGHTSAEAAGVFAAVRRAAPRTVLTTHAMIGFPGETEKDFEATLALLRNGGFDRIDVFEYSDRPGTRASEMVDKVPPPIVRSRSRRLRTEFGGRIAGVEYLVRSILSETRP